MAWDFGIRGTQSVDARNKAARTFVANRCKSHTELNYNLANKQFEIDGIQYRRTYSTHDYVASIQF